MNHKPKQRLSMTIQGLVQGVGFRPFVFRLATDLGLSGWVQNTARGVFIDVEGHPQSIQDFIARLPLELPPQAAIHHLEYVWLDPAAFTGFEIKPSGDDGFKKALVLPDLAVCPDCLHDVFDPQNRRYLYPFTNCTNCGPRYSIIQRLPYDRKHTTMHRFQMCAACQHEYEDPRDRRFHAQPNACPACGPQVALWDRNGALLDSQQAALQATANAILAGKILAVKGLGGFHLMVAAGNETAVLELRRRKQRDEKPLALMFPSLEMLSGEVVIAAVAKRLLTSTQAPIVLLPRHPGSGMAIAPGVAPHHPYLGVMLPYTPLHHILLKLIGAPVVATSGNLSDEPICFDEREALTRLHDIADLFLVHNRPIMRHVDDSVVRVINDREMVIRRARGYAPLPIYFAVPDRTGCASIEKDIEPPSPQDSHTAANPSAPHMPETDRTAVLQPASILAVGAHLKNAVAVTTGNMCFLSQHIGDLETGPACQAFQQVIHDLGALYELCPTQVVCDAHPDYIATKFAQEHAQRHSNAQPLMIQHHYAHIAAAMAENDVRGSVLGVSWDGTGYGLDGTIWGGEFLLATETDFTRIAHLRSFPLPGGERAIKEPWRTAVGLLYEIQGERLFAEANEELVATLPAITRKTMLQMLAKGINCPSTSSVGRLFDGVAALIGLRRNVNHEGQAALELEFALPSTPIAAAYELAIGPTPTGLIIDWQPLLAAVMNDLQRHESISIIAAKFHNALVKVIVEVAKKVGRDRVVISGGCFQNVYLLERTIAALTEAGFQAYWPQRVPPNDGGIALGQAAIAYYRQFTDLTSQ